MIILPTLIRHLEECFEGWLFDVEYFYNSPNDTAY